ncbi:hypothetical protein CTAYLR_003806 [Chrysophaeum taylorii]|uniref:Uncharacterized protein n=1 Tax=Chrysophaeum taylorii TaxID=2483200 RepID=A0AAD7UFV8_9STRA|nr:hypothetical protein CTAYLR_003806 [Chrysophaeum taylorii]
MGLVMILLAAAAAAAAVMARTEEECGSPLVIAVASGNATLKGVDAYLYRFPLEDEKIPESRAFAFIVEKVDMGALEHWWSDPRYVHIDGRPLVISNELHIMESPMGPYVGQRSTSSQADFGMLWEPRLRAGVPEPMSAVVNAAVCDALLAFRGAKKPLELSVFGGYDDSDLKPPHLATKIHQKPGEFARLLATMKAVSRRETCSNVIVVNSWSPWLEELEEAPEPDEDLIASCGNSTREEDVRMRGDLARQQLREWRNRPVPESSSFSKVFVISAAGSREIGLAVEDLGFQVYHLETAGITPEKTCFQENLYPNSEDAVMFSEKARTRLFNCFQKFGIFDEYRAFYDVPFYGLLPNLLAHYPDAKFIYEMRPVEEWWLSTTSYFPETHDVVYLRNETFGKGNLADVINGIMYGARHERPETPKDRAVRIEAYVNQARDVMALFSDREDRLLVVDADVDGYDVIAPFLGMPHAATWEFPSPRAAAAAAA